MRGRTRTIAAAFAAVALVIAACTGGDDDPQETGAASVSTPVPTAAAPTPTATPPPAAPAPAETPASTPVAAATPPPTSSPSPTAAPAPVEEAAPELPVTVTDAEGAEFVVEDVSRVVVLNGNITEIVFALGLGDHVVGVDATSTYPPEAQDLPEVGVQIQLNAEGIIALQPTLVLGNTFAGPPEVIEQVRGAGIPVLILPDHDTLESIGEKIRGIARALGVPLRGERLAAESQASIEEAMSLVDGVESQPRVAFLYLRGTQFQLIGGVDSGATSLIEAAGGIDVGVEIGIRGFMQITPEALVTANPDVILIFTSGLTSIGGVDGLLELPGVAQTGAGRTRTIVDFDGQYLFGYGPRSGAALAELIVAIHPGLDE